jgi:hypothetical protein
MTAAEGPAMMVWFTVELEDKPGSLARVAAALAERGVNITGIVGVAEDTDGALMLTTSDPEATRKAFEALALPFEEHGGLTPEMDGMTIRDLRGR